jgi:phospholipid/cholesterol/gamma-HCH transport system substrate-binding protein
MARFTQAARVGAFVLVSAAGAYFVYRTISHDVGVGSGYVIHGYLDDASGIANHSRVTIAGIPVGSIDSIKLENGKARVDIRMNGDVPLFTDATMGKKASSLLGENIIVLAAGAKNPKLKDGDLINTVPEEGSIDEIKKNLADVSKLVKDVAEQLAKSIGTEQGGANIKAILQNLADVTDALNQTVRENRESVKQTLAALDRISTRGEPEIAAILENMRVISDDLKNVTAALNGRNGSASGNELKDTIEHVDKASKSLESTLDHLDHVADRLDKGEGTMGRLTKDDALINEVQGIAEGVNDIVQPISRLQTVVGLRSDYNFLANTIKSYVEVRLQPREDKYYSIELINDPRGKTTFTQTDVDTTNPTQPAHYRTITTTTTDAFRFSLQFARTLGPFTGRFGIKESTGGIGLDIHLFNKRFEIVNDLFGFGEEIQPRYRVYLSYQFINRLWLIGGVDHLFLANRRDYFVGLMLRFTDDDLKTILPFAGGATPK